MHRVTANVDGVSLYFESSDTMLLATPEAFASALLVQAMHMQVDLIFENQLSPTWLSNAGKLMGIFRDWWGYRPIQIHAEKSCEAPGTKGQESALVFSGGADSFYSLLNPPFPISNLVFMKGCDVWLHETDRLNIMEASVRTVAESMGVKPIIITTNLKEHPLAGRKYKYTHGAVLAAVGYLLPNVNRLVISSSLQKGVSDQPWGSHWKTDPLWGSEALEVIHYGEKFARIEKLRLIAGEPVVQQNLRVCQGSQERRQNDPGYNCGRCEKCVRTMLVLLQCGYLDKFPLFLRKEELKYSLDEILFLSDVMVPVYKKILMKGLEAQLAHSIDLLLDRTEKVRPFLRLGKHATDAMAHLLLPRPIGKRLKGFFRALKK